MTNRSDLSQVLSTDIGTPTKTFILDCHVEKGGSAQSLLEECFGDDRVLPTDDAFLFRVIADGGDFWVDQLDQRFWSFHTKMGTGAAYQTLSSKVETRRDLDWIWLPSGHLQNFWPGATPRSVATDFRGSELLGEEEPATVLSLTARGSGSRKLVERIREVPSYRAAVAESRVQVSINEPELGHVTETLNRKGRFLMSGDSIALHGQVVERVVERYKRFVEICEARAFNWERSATDGLLLGGEAILVSFSRPIPDWDAFLGTLLSAKQPFRLWGSASVDGQIAAVDAVDLHIGHALNFDVGRTWMRIYLDRGCCGNTITRLLSNLQSHFDSALQLMDPELAEAFEASNDSVMTA